MLLVVVSMAFLLYWAVHSEEGQREDVRVGWIEMVTKLARVSIIGCCESCIVKDIKVKINY